MPTETKSPYLEPPIITVTLETSFHDHVRWEGEGKGQIFGAWWDDLERVGASIGSSECGANGAEINFEITLSQAFELGWDWDSEGEPTEYLAEKVLEADGMEFTETEMLRVACEIRILWDTWKESQGSTQLTKEA